MIYFLLSALFFIASSLQGFDEVRGACCMPSPTNWCQIGTAGFSTSDTSNWYEITTFSYPTPTPLSFNRNIGSTQGNVQLTDSGLIIGQSGNYWANITATVINNGDDPLLIPTFLVYNGVFDPLNQNTVGGVGLALPGQLITIQASGVLQNVPGGTALSIIATNGGSGAVPISIVSWGISVFRIPCMPN